MATREYDTVGITVLWDSDRCIHSGVCAASLPRVFRPAERPWLHPDEASADQLAATIDRCPSGALGYRRHDTAGGSVEDADAVVTAPAAVTITPTQNGPLEVTGAVTVVAADGTVLTEATRLYLCRCGHSENKPFCDGHHRRVGFTDDGLGRRTGT